jgi:hypothetical protein
MHLLDRALAIPDVPPAERTRCLFLSAWALNNTGGGGRIVPVLREAVSAAAISGDEALRLTAQMQLASEEWRHDPFVDDAELVRQAEHSASAFQRMGDRRRHANACYLLSVARERRVDYAAAARLLDDAANGSVDGLSVLQARVRRLFVDVRGAVPVGVLRDRGAALLAEAEPYPVFAAELLGVLAEVDAMADGADEARLAEARVWLESSSSALAPALLAGPTAHVRLLKGDPAASVPDLRAAVEHFTANDDLFNGGEYAVLLALVLHEAGAFDEAAGALALARRSGANRAVWDRTNCDRVEALLAAR